MHFTPIILSVALVVVSACSKLDEFTQFTMNYDETVVIPSSTSINLPLNIFTPDVETNSESTFETNNTRTDLVEEIKLTTLRLSITSPSNADFSFLESISVYLSAEGLEEKKIAWKDVIPANSNSLILNVSDSNLKEYISKKSISIRLQTVTDELLTSDYEIKIHSEFFVDAKVFGS